MSSHGRPYHVSGVSISPKEIGQIVSSVESSRLIESNRLNYLHDSIVENIADVLTQFVSVISNKNSAYRTYI